MGIRDNVRQRRRERIVQLLGEQPLNPVEWNVPKAEAPLAPPKETFTLAADSDPDPEKWWKEQQKRMNTASPVWTQAGRLAPTSNSGASASVSTQTFVRTPGAGRGRISRFVRGFALRAAAAAVLYGAAWGWFNAGLPGSAEARSWMITAVTQDMDFQAVSVWYEHTFGGSPSFLPMFRSTGESQAVSGAWKRNEAVLPVDGRIVTTFAQDGGGVRLAAPGGSGVKAVYAGRVLQVATENDGKATVLIQHAGRIVTVYGNVENPGVLPNDWVEAGQQIGVVPAPRDEGGESLLYFAVKQNGKTLDPAEVVPFD